jgi:hypothetical protein
MEWVACLASEAHGMCTVNMAAYMEVAKECTMREREMRERERKRERERQREREKERERKKEKEGEEVWA